MTIAPYLREIGRGAKGARSLKHRSGTRPDGAVARRPHRAPLEVGAFAIGMRMKGESVDELIGFVQALHERLAPLPSDRPVIAIASYNGARRLPNLVPLLALLAGARRRACAGARPHCTTRDRVTTAQVFRGARHAPGAVARRRASRLGASRAAPLCPRRCCRHALERLLQVRRTIGPAQQRAHDCQDARPGARRSLPAPDEPHPPRVRPADGRLRRTAQAHMGLLRGTEGEAVADPRRLPRQQIWLGGIRQADLASEPEPGSLATLAGVADGHRPGHHRGVDRGHLARRACPLPDADRAADRIAVDGRWRVCQPPHLSRRLSQPGVWPAKRARIALFAKPAARCRPSRLAALAQHALDRPSEPGTAQGNF